VDDGAVAVAFETMRVPVAVAVTADDAVVLIDSGWGRARRLCNGGEVLEAPRDERVPLAGGVNVNAGVGVLVIVPSQAAHFRS
jgi:hypothetical protein